VHYGVFIRVDLAPRTIVEQDLFFASGISASDLALLRFFLRYDIGIVIFIFEGFRFFFYNGIPLIFKYFW
jgi:hypothetical protein